LARKKDFRRVDQRFDQVDQRFDQIDARFERVDARFDSLQQTIIAVGGGLIGTLIVASAGLIATQP
jgi:hypothetical protein